MNRRDLIKAFAVAAPMTVAGRVWAAPATDARLLVVFLRGAYDAANVVVPVSSDFYHTSRPTLGIAKPDAGNPNSALSLGADWGLHPALRDSIYPLWAQARDRVRSVCRHIGRSDAEPFRDPGHHRTRPVDRRFARLSLGLHEPARDRTVARQADFLYRPAAADFSRQVADSEYRAQQRRQAGRRRSPGPADQEHVCAKRSCFLGVGRVSNSRRRLPLDLGGNDRGQSRRGVAARLRTIGAAHRPADARAIQSRLRRRRRLGYPRQPGRAPPVILPTGSANSAARWRDFPKRSGLRDGAIPWWS